MLFSSPVFLFLFLPLTLLLYYILPKKFKNAFLLLMSIAFYSWGESELVLLILLSAIVDFSAALIIETGKKKLGLSLSLIFNLGILLYFKYADFAFTNLVGFLNQFNISIDDATRFSNVILPLGISFYTFQTMSYTIDVYRGHVKADRNFINFATYVTLFPQLIAGPIVRYKDVEKELKNRETTIPLFAEGVERFIIGLAKKMIIANNCAFLADGIFNMPNDEMSSLLAWLGVIAYSFQIYYDFSGYSDMAIGLGRMFGFNFLENFNSPFVSKNIQEFWRRWHISLSTWFRDYIYFPLGGNRNGLFRSFLNLMVVFFVTGLWHGASWNFVIWGLFHGMFIIFEKLGLNDILKKSRLLAFSYTMLVVNIGWLLFRLEDLAASKSYALQLLGLNDGEIIKNLSQTINIQQVVVLILGSLMSIRVFLNLEVKLKSIASSNATFNRIYQIGDVVLPILVLIVSSLAIATSTYNPFIYFRF